MEVPPNLCRCQAPEGRASRLTAMIDLLQWDLVHSADAKSTVASIACNHMQDHRLDARTDLVTNQGYVDNSALISVRCATPILEWRLRRYIFGFGEVSANEKLNSDAHRFLVGVLCFAAGAIGFVLGAW